MKNKKKHTKAAKQKMREAHKGKKLTKKHKEKIRQSLLGRICSDKTRKKISDKLKGKKLSKKQRENVSRGHIGLKHSRATKKKISDAHKGSKNYNWKGGRTMTAYGYVLLYKPNHPRANTKGYVLEHRLVMERKIGRYLKKSEIVHHINGIKNDNRIKNLVITNLKLHKLKYHKKNKVCKVKNCNNKHVALGYCNKHYKRLKRYEAKKKTI